MTHRVDDLLGGGDPVGVTVAGLEPDEVAVPVGLEAPFEIGLVEASDGGVGSGVEAGVIDGDVEDGGLLTGRAHGVVDGHGQHLTGGGAQESHPVAGLARAVDRGEGATDDDLGVVRGDLDRVDLGVGALGGRGPVQELAGGGLEGGHPDARLTVHLGEVAPDVEGVAGHCDVLDGGAEHGLEGGDEGSVPLGDVEGGQAAVPLVIDPVELPGDVEGLAVLGEGQASSRTVEGGGEVLDELPGIDVVGQDVGARDLLLSCKGPGRPGVAEATDDVDHVADDELSPGDAVDLRRRQRRGRVRRLLGGLAGGISGTRFARAIVVVASAGIDVGVCLVIRRRHRSGGGEEDHRGEEERNKEQNDEKAGSAGAASHGNLREI